MCRSFPVLALFASLAFAAQASDWVDSSPRTKVPVPAAAAKSVGWPFAAKIAVATPAVVLDAAPQLPELGGQERRGAQRACRFALCYDAADMQLAYPGSRDYMPTFAGLTPEKISVRRNRIIFKYSFK